MIITLRREMSNMQKWTFGWIYNIFISTFTTNISEKLSHNSMDINVLSELYSYTYFVLKYKKALFCMDILRFKNLLISKIYSEKTPCKK